MLLWSIIGFGEFWWAAMNFGGLWLPHSSLPPPPHSYPQMRGVWYIYISICVYIYNIIYIYIIEPCTATPGSMNGLFSDFFREFGRGILAGVRDCLGEVWGGF